MTYNSLAVAIAVATGIMLATSGSAASVLAQQYTAPPTAPKAGNPSGNSPMKSGNTTSAGGMMNKTAAGNATKAGNTTTLSGQGTPGTPFKPTGNMTAGNTTAANMTKAAGNATSTTITKLGQAIGGGLKGLGNTISGGKK
ncbi:MAG: hypothetical protein M3P08_19435 [Thermoproteota archaeon]|nr:hypothetical protein [Thermoproteota archaeon]